MAVAVCAVCGENYGPSARFCSSCGGALRLPEGLQEERKIISVLFVDLVGFTSRSDHADPEDVRDVLRAYHREVKRAIERYGGTVEKYIGDAVMAVFGAPQSHSDDAERAIRAGLSALAVVEALEVRGADHTLTARAGVTTGEAIVATGVTGASGDALAMGDVVNTASRLQTGAPSGGLVVDEETHRATRNMVRYEPLEPLSAKGKAELLPIWLAVEVTGSPGSRAPGRAPMMGRDLELSMLSSVWERTRHQQRPHVSTVLGPPGAGKSRLAHEFGIRVREQGGRVVEGQCSPYDQSDVFSAFTQQLKQLAAVTDVDSPLVARTKLDDLLDRVVPAVERPDVQRCTSVLLGPGLDDPLVPEQKFLLYAFRRLVEAVSLEQPTLFVFEDIHWADSAEFELIRYLGAHVRDVPAVFLVLARPELVENRPQWTSGSVVSSTIVLEPLGRDDAAVVVRALGGSRLAADTVFRLVDTAEGSPLFLEELTSAVLEGAGTAEQLPTSVRAAIASRIDALPQPLRSVLLAASVMGRTFWVSALSAAEDTADLMSALNDLEERDIVRRQPTSTVRGDVEFMFRHVLIRDVCYGTLPRAERARLHSAIATQLEESVGDDRELAWLLAHHWEEAGEPVRAIPYLLAAAERAQAALAEEETIALLDRAERLAPDEATRLQIRLTRGLALARFESFDQARDELEPLLSLLTGAHLLDAVLAFAQSCHWTERTEQAIEAGTRAVELVHQLNLAEYAGPALARLSQAYAMRGAENDLPRAMELGEQALADWLPGVRTEDLAEHEHLLADQHYWTGNYGRALLLARSARERAEDPSSAESRLRGGGMEALLLASMGRYEESLLRFDEVIALGREMGRPVRVVLNYSTLAYRELYDLDEARRRSEEVLDGMVKGSFHMPWMNAEVDLIHVDLLAGELSAAIKRWETMWPSVLATSAWERWLLGSKLAAFRAEIALKMHGAAAAADWATRALQMTRTVRRAKYEIAARCTLGEALLQLGRSGDAVREFRTAARTADAIGNPPARWRAHAQLAKALYSINDDAGAAASYQEAKGVVQSVAETLAPDRASRLLAAAPVDANDFR